MFGWYMEEAEMRYRDRLQEIEQIALRREALAARPTGASVRSRAMAHLGGWLVARGKSLQARYSAGPPASGAGTAALSLVAHAPGSANQLESWRQAA